MPYASWGSSWICKRNFNTVQFSLFCVMEAFKHGGGFHWYHVIVTVGFLSTSSFPLCGWAKAFVVASQTPWLSPGTRASMCELPTQGQHRRAQVS